MLKYLSGFLLFTFLGYLGNYFALPLFFGADFIFGSIFGLAATYKYGLKIGLAVSAIASIQTIFRWNQPFSAGLLILEALWVGIGVARNRKQQKPISLVWLVLTYWLCLGAPLCFLSYFVALNFEINSAILVVLKQTVNTLFNALIAHLLIDYVPLPQWLNEKHKYGQTGGRESISIQQTLFNLLLVFVLLPVLSIASFTGTQSLQYVNNEISTQLDNTSIVLVKKFENWHYRNLLLLNKLAKTAAETNNLGDDSGNDFTRLQLVNETLGQAIPSFSMLYTTDEQGKIVTIYPNISQSKKELFKTYSIEKEVFNKAKDTRNTLFTDIHSNKITSLLHIDIVVPIIDSNNQFKGVVVGVLDITQIDELLSNSISNRNITALLVERSQSVIADTQVDAITDELWNSSEGGEEKTFRKNQVQWLPFMAGKSTMTRWRGSLYRQRVALGGDIPWSLVVQLSPIDFINNLEHLYTYILLIVLGITLVAVAVARLLSRRLVKPIADLIRLTTNLQQNLSTATDFTWKPRNLAEIDILGYNFQVMAIALQEKFQEIQQANLYLEERVQERSHELFKSEERWQLAIQAANDGIWDWDLETGIIFRSDRWFTMLGMEIIHNQDQPMDWLSMIHPEDREQLLQLQGDYFEHRVSQCRIEYRIRCQDGSYKWILSHAKALWNDDGKPIRLVGINSDISDRKLAIETLKQRESYLTILVEIQRYLLAEKDIQEYTHILKMLGTISNFSSIKLFIYEEEDEFDFELTSLEPYATWHDQNIKIPQKTQQKQFIQQLINFHWISRLKNNEVINESLSSISNAERVILNSKNLASVLLMPVMANKKFWGFLSFHDYHSDRPRDQLEISLLSIFASSLAMHLERKQSKIEMLQAMQSAQAANRAKSDFLATMSHEIRTPMNAVMGMASLMLDTTLDAEQQEFVEIIRSSGNNLLTIINDILDFSKIESGKFSLDIYTFNLRHCIEDSLNLLAKSALNKGIKLAYCMDCDVPEFIVSDATRLRQVLVNLISNAVKFTATGSVTVKVSLLSETISTEDNDDGLGELHTYQLSFSVSDTGIGIPQDCYDRLFQPFSQVDSSTTRRYGGTGLGLAICWRLTELLGGDISIDSTVGVGSTFTFSISANAIKIEARDNDYCSDVDSKSDLAGRCILIVDDNQVSREGLVNTVRNLGLQAIATSSMAEAIACLQETTKFDFAIIDTTSRSASDKTNIASLLRAKSTNLPIILLGLNLDNDAKASLDISDPLICLMHHPVKRSHVCRELVKFCNKKQISKPSQNVRSAIFDEGFAKKYPLNLLLVEDNALNRTVALRFLKRLGYGEVDVVVNGAEALESLKHKRYDVILMDIFMPVMDGVIATKQIIQNFPIHPWIIALTANALQGDREVYLQAGMNDYVSKPIQIKELTDALTKAYSYSKSS
ncbi:response regulator [Pseudanabaena biceps]|nr:response regulator [Pseudanabaena biceps]